MNALSSTPTENLVKIKGEVNSSKEESARSEVKHVCAHNPSLPSLSISSMMSYINEKTTGERDVEKR